VPYRLISLLAAHKALLAGSPTGVYFYMGVAAVVIGGIWSVRVLLAVAAVRKVGV